MNPQSSPALRFGQRTQLSGAPGTDLESLSTYELPDGCEVVVVLALLAPDIFILVKTDDTTVPDGVNVIAPGPGQGPGRWFRYSFLHPGGQLAISANNGLANSSQSSGTVLFGNANGVSFGMVGSTVTASITPGAAAGIDAISGGTTQATSGTVVFGNANNVSFGVDGQTVTASVAPAGSISAGTTSASLGQVVFAAGSGVTFGMAGNTVTASVAAQSTQPGPSAISASGSSVSAGTVVFSNSNNVSFGMNGSTVTGSASFSQSAQPAGSISAGTTSASLGQVVFGNSNSVSFGMNAGTVTASFSQSAAPIGGIVAGTEAATLGTVSFQDGFGISFGLDAQTLTAAFDAIKSLSAGTTQITNGQVSFKNTNGVSFGINGQTLTASVAVGSLSAGTTSASLGQVVFSSSGSGNIAFGMDGNTITASYSSTPAPRSQFFWEPAIGGSSLINASIGTLFPVQVPYSLTFSRIDIPMLFSFGSTTTSNTAAIAVSSALVLFSRSGSTLNPIVGTIGNTTYSYASNTANYNSVTGARLVSFPLATSIAQGQYFVYAQVSTAQSSVGAATTALGASVSVPLGTVYTASGYADFGGLANGTSNVVLFRGVIPQITNTTQTVQMSQVSGTGASYIRANLFANFRNE